MIPAWFLHLLAPIYSESIARLFNLSLSSSKIPEKWRLAHIRPISKISPPVSPSDFRPVSAVPVLSRILELLVVCQFVDPTLVKQLMDLLIQDQFAFKPSGSMTAALIDLLQKINNMLQRF